MRKNTFLMLITCELLLFSVVYIRGVQGLGKIRHLQYEVQGLDTEVSTLEEQINILKQRIEDWRSHPFYAEQCARERLHMARPTEKIVML